MASFFKKPHLILYGLVLIGLSFMLAKVINKPRVFQVIKPSLFEDFSEAGFWIGNQLRKDLGNSTIIALGVEPQQISILKNFLKAHPKAFNPTYFLPLKGYSTKTDWGPKILADIKNPEEFVKKYEGLLRNGAVIILPAQEASHLIPNSMVNRMEKALQMSIFSLSLVGWQLEKEIPTQCADWRDRVFSLKSLDCLQYGRASARFAEKKAKSKKIAGHLRRYSSNEFIFSFAL